MFLLFSFFFFFFFFLSFCFSSFKDEGVFLYRPDWPETHYVEEAGLDFTDLPASASPRYVPPCSVFVVELFFFSSILSVSVKQS